MLDTSPSLHELLAGRYVLKREIGRGGAATVYLAHDIRHERLVAIKVLHPELSHTLGAQRFLREIKLTAGLQHPHILSIHDSGAADSRLWYVMPFVEGDSLRQRLGACSRLSIEEAVRIGREVAGALAYAHERGIVHRDIKPENILFSGGHAVLADFGIARAIDRAQEKVTGQGTITGTPAYMSPEQARARPFDGRSDVYSLACVLYESIAGVPPFVGDTPQAMLQQRISSSPPRLREYRHDVPPVIEAAIARALATSPDDRYADARAFSAALSAALGNSGEVTPAHDQRAPGWRSPWLWAAAVTLFMSGGAALSPGARSRLAALATRVDSTQYAVLPFSYVGGGAPAAEMEPVAQVVYSELREWRGVRLASDVGVLDALRHEPGRSLPGMQAVARAVRAGRLVWGRVWTQHDSLRVRIGVYDARDGAALREVTVVGSRDALLARAGGLRGVVADLLRDDGRHPIAPAADVGTRSLAAWRAYEEARHALDDWRVPAARAALERAVAADPAFARPRVWLAQLGVWRDEPASAWVPHLAVATQGRATLSRRESLAADALVALSRGRFVESCTAYRAMRDADSLDAAAWLGLAYCHGTDRRVVRARGAPGWAIAGSIEAAEHAYERAVSIAPGSFTAFSFGLVVQRLFPLEGERIQRGYASDSAPWVARLGLDHDTLALVAHPFASLARRSVQEMTSHNDAALARVRDRLRGILVTLAQRLPDEPDVYESLALVLEVRDEITGTPNGGYSALTAIERARMVAGDTTQRARIGAADIRLHLKLADFSRAAALGDSMLAAAPHATGTRADYLAGIAALLGREHDAVRYLRASGQSVGAGPTNDPPLVEDASTALFVRTALGVCDDSVRVLQHRLETLLESYVDPNRRPGARRDHLQRPIILAADCLGPMASLAIEAPTIHLVRIMQLLGRGDRRHARSMLDSLQATRVSLRPGALALDHTRAEAWVHAVTGDTAAAIRQLDLSLTALPTLGTRLVYEPGMAAAVGRTMAYRAELAARTGDRGTAALWASRVLTLWAHADRSLAPTVARMTQLATGTS